MHDESIECTTYRPDVDETFVQRFNPGSAVLKGCADLLRGLNHLINDPPGCARKRLLYTMFILFNTTAVNDSHLGGHRRLSRLYNEFSAVSAALFAGAMADTI